MARKPLIGVKEREAIRIAFMSLSKASPMVKAESIRQKASELCGRELGLSTVQRELVPLRNPPETPPKDIDAPWTIGSTGKYPVAPNLVSLLVSLKTNYEQNGGSYTIRTALWCVRLIAMPDTIESLEKPVAQNGADKIVAKLEHLVGAASAYALWEKFCEDHGIAPVDTGFFDAPTLTGIIDKAKVFFQKDGEAK